MKRWYREKLHINQVWDLEGVGSIAKKIPPPPPKITTLDGMSVMVIKNFQLSIYY